MNEFIFDRTITDLALLTSKAYYNASDLNRIEGNISELSTILNGLVYTQKVTVKTDWANRDFPSAVSMERIRQNIRKLISAFCVKADTPSLPDTLNKMDINKANAIEKILFDINQEIAVVRSLWPICGTFESGEL